VIHPLFINGNARFLALADGSVQTIVTSPPSDADAVELFALKVERFAPCDVLVGKRLVGNSTNRPNRIGKVSVARDFRSMLIAVGLQFPKRKNAQSGLPLHAKKRKKRTQNVLGCEVAHLVAVKRSAASNSGFLLVVPASERFRHETNRRFINHPHLNSGMVAGRLPALSRVSGGLLDSDVSLSIDESG